MDRLDEIIADINEMNVADFNPAPMSDKERIDMQEDAILELAELIGEML